MLAEEGGGLKMKGPCIGCGLTVHVYVTAFQVPTRRPSSALANGTRTAITTRKTATRFTRNSSMRKQRRIFLENNFTANHRQQRRDVLDLILGNGHVVC